MNKINDVHGEPCLDFTREATTNIVIETRDLGNNRVLITKIKTKHIESITKVCLRKKCLLNEENQKHILMKLLGMA